MTPPNTVKNILKIIALGLLLHGSASVYACSKFDIKCKLKEAADKASNEAKTVGKDITKAANDAASTALEVEAKANGFANAAEAETASKAMGFASYAERMEKDSLDIAGKEYNTLKKDAVKAYATDLAAAQKAYVATQNSLKTMLKDGDSLLSFMKNQCTAGSCQAMKNRH